MILIKKQAESRWSILSWEGRGKVYTSTTQGNILFNSFDELPSYTKCVHAIRIDAPDTLAEIVSENYGNSTEDFIYDVLGVNVR